MNRGWLLGIVLFCGCEGERVQGAREDVGALVDAPVDALVDALDALDANETAAPGECGMYRGAKMVRVGSFCIDATEVTRGQFLEYLAAPAAERMAARPAECAWNTTDPTINPTASLLGLPVDETNFCDATTYCAWANKRLCGRIGGGVNAPEDLADATKSEWFAVCSVNGTQTYPYGAAYSRARCFTEEATIEATGSRTGCAGASSPYSEVFDLSGNVFEWENSCTASPSATSTRCRARGGSFGGGAAATCAVDDLTNVDTRLPGFGFRCCNNAAS